MFLLLIEDMLCKAYFLVGVMRTKRNVGMSVETGIHYTAQGIERERLAWLYQWEIEFNRKLCCKTLKIR